MSTPVVRVDEVSRRFVIRQEKSLKERLVNFGRSQKHKNDFWALRDVSFEIDSGSTVGLIGPNGSGKSTLLKTIGGIIQPTSGSVALRGRLAALLELGAGFHPDLTGRENVYLNASILGLSRAQTDRYFDAIVDFSGIERFIDTQVKFYSSGMYVRLAFSVAVHVDPDILLVDEVLAVGDEPFQRKCMDRIKSFQAEGRTIVLVTHALGQVAELCDRAIVLEHGHLVADGPPRESLKALRSEFQITRQEELSRFTSALAKVRAVEMISGSSSGAAISLRPGDDLTLRVLVDAEEPLERWNLSVGIEDLLGRAVLGTDADKVGLRLPPTTGERVVDFQLRDLGIGAGEYSINATLSDGEGREAHKLIDAGVLTVVDDATTAGPAFARATATIDVR
jgi:ABC-2 type transport system ATP-binding protein